MRPILRGQNGLLHKPSAAFQGQRTSLLSTRDRARCPVSLSARRVLAQVLYCRNSSFPASTLARDKISELRTLPEESIGVLCKTSTTMSRVEHNPLICHNSPAVEHGHWFWMCQSEIVMIQNARLILIPFDWIVLDFHLILAVAHGLRPWFVSQSVISA